MKPDAQIKKATKQLVDSLLAMNTSNRNPKPSVIDSYARDIVAGKWMLTNQGIGVTSDNVLVDGQHRLLALKKCGYPEIDILLVTGLDPAAQTAVDAHAKRSARDLLQFAFDIRVSHCAPAIGNALIAAEDRSWKSGRVTNSELFEKISFYMDEISEVTTCVESLKFFSASFLAAFCKMLKENPDKKSEIKDFMKRVEAGEMLSKTMPEFHLRSFIITSRQASGNGAVRKERFDKTIKAITAALEGRSMGVLRA